MTKLHAAMALEVHAPLSIVWDVIQDFESLPAYNSTYVSIERLENTRQKNNSTEKQSAARIQPNDQFRVVRQDGKVELKGVTSVTRSSPSTSNDDDTEECSISFVESCTSTYTLVVKAIDKQSCYLIGSFGASPNSFLTRLFIRLCGPCLRPLAVREFARREVEPVRAEAEARLRGRKLQLG